MKPLRTRLQEARKLSGIPWEILERDYLLSWILAGIYRVNALRDTLVFKGGTALKKCYFGDYRFSEDLDFSGLEGVPTGDALENDISEACAVASSMLDEYAPVEIELERYIEKDPHPGGQEAFTIRGQLPWQRQPMTRVMVEISMDEDVIKPVPNREVIHEYGEALSTKVPVYALEEIVAEKLRAILQHVEKLEARGWSRSRARDYYDMWRIFGAYSSRMDMTGFKSFLKEKCILREVSFKDAGDFFQEAMLANVEKTWEQWLGPLVPDLPSFAKVMRELRPQINAIIEME